MAYIRITTMSNPDGNFSNANDAWASRYSTLTSDQLTTLESISNQYPRTVSWNNETKKLLTVVTFPDEAAHAAWCTAKRTAMGVADEENTLPVAPGWTQEPLVFKTIA